MMNYKNEKSYLSYKLDVTPNFSSIYSIYTIHSLSHTHTHTSNKHKEEKVSLKKKKIIKRDDYSKNKLIKISIRSLFPLFPSRIFRTFINSCL